MKTSSLWTTAIVLLAAVGCGDRSQTETQPKQTWHQPWSATTVDMPDWVRDPSRDGKFIATYGSALRGELALSEQKAEAVANARKELARMMYVKIQSAFQSYVAESGVGSDATATRFVQDVSRQVSVVGIKNTVVREQWINPKTDELFVWVVVDPTLANRLAAEVGTTAKQEAAKDPARAAHLNAKLASDNAFAELDRTLDQQFKKKD